MPRLNRSRDFAAYQGRTKPLLKPRGYRSTEQASEGASAAEGNGAVPPLAPSCLFLRLYHPSQQANTSIQHGRIACSVTKQAGMWCVSSQIQLFNSIFGLLTLSKKSIRSTLETWLHPPSQPRSPLLPTPVLPPSLTYLITLLI